MINTEKRSGRRLRIVVTAGPTREYFDSVRFLSNPSSGKMGYAIAAAAAEAGYAVTLVSGPVELRPPSGVRTISVISAREMADAAKQAFRAADAAILTAAVCDYRPKRRAVRKIAKSNRPKRLELVPTEDIAASLGRIKGKRVTIAFAMEDHNGRSHAERKMRRKNCDAIVLNGRENIGTDRARVEYLVSGGVWRRWPIVSKKGLARRLVGELAGIMGDKEQS
ncbi:MAG: phosphopantothenoylcysteine decarboxylase [Phycisphaerae bacterium]